MAAMDIIKKGFIGALAGGALAYFFPQIMNVSIIIWGVPAGILGAIGIILRVLLGAVIGAFIQIVISKNK